MAKALERSFKSEHNSETGHQFFIYFKSLLQLKAQTADLHPALTKTFYKTKLVDHRFQKPYRNPCSAEQHAAPMLKAASQAKSWSPLILWANPQKKELASSSDSVFSLM